MVNRLLALQDPLLLFDMESNSVKPISKSQRKLLQSAMKNLAPFQELTLDLSKASATAGMMIPSAVLLTHKLKQLPDDGAGSMKDAIIEEMQRRFKDLEGKQAISTATFLDPRFKGNLFKTHGTLQMVEETLSSSSVVAQPPSDAPNEEPPAKKPKSDSLWDALSLFTDAGAKTNAPSGMAAEIAAYKGEANAAPTTDPLQWWSVNGSRFPQLAATARRYLSAPPTSVDSERLFSISGNICNDRRSRMSPDKLEQLVFLHVNVRLLNYNY